MNTKTITRRGRQWLWPEYDTELIKVFDQVDDIDTILEYCPKRRTAIQAGGGCGVWPWRLAQEFEAVYTFEPDRLNLECLKENVPDTRVTVFSFALADGERKYRVERHNTERTNAGAGYCVELAESDGISSAIDSIPCCGRIDLIQLDIEGWEELALKGAKETIERLSPTIVIEEKRLPQGGDHLAARRLLESWGYVERAKVHRDVIFTR